MIRAHEFQHQGRTLRATLHIPDGETRRPVVVFVHGFSNNRMRTAPSS
ncbi:hypothetical protein [Nonomuraea sp. 10N515B]